MGNPSMKNFSLQEMCACACMCDCTHLREQYVSLILEVSQFGKSFTTHLVFTK